MPCTRREFLQMLGATVVSSLASGCGPSEVKRKPELENYPSGKILFLSDFEKEEKTSSEYTKNIEGVPIGNGKLWLANSDGSEVMLVADNVRTLPLWSPKGDKFIALLNSEYRTESAMYDQSGHNLSWMFSGSNLLDYVWSPDGNSIIHRFWEYDLEKSPIEKALSHPTRKILDIRAGVWDHDISLSPDGKKFVFVHHEFGKRCLITLADYDREKMPYEGEDHFNWVTNPNFTILYDGYTTTHDARFKFQWTPDGKKIVCLGNDGVFVLDTVNKSRPFIDLGFCKPHLQGVAIDWFAQENVDLSSDGTKIVVGREGSLFITDWEQKLKRCIALPDNGTAIPYRVRWLANDQVISFELEGQYYYIDPKGSNLRKASIDVAKSKPFGFSISSAGR